MEYKVFYRKYRPKNFNELVGQENIKDVLVNSIKLNKIAHAYIFTGPRGTGKTSTAKIFAKTLNCINNSTGISCEECDMCKTYNDSADIIEIDAASNNGVEEIRSLRDSVKIAPYNSKYKVYIIDEVHMLSNSAWNAFLKTLEEPPNHVIFILATTEINKIPETVKSRCQRFDFLKIPDSLMLEHLSKICKLENIDITSEALKQITKLSNGCLRDALSYLDKISKFDRKIDEELIENNFGILNDTKLESLYLNIKNNDIEKINDEIDIISNSGITPLNFINDFINYLVNKIINKEIKDYKEMELIKEIVNKLNSLVTNFNSVINPFILIKIELITIKYFPGNNDVDISQKMIKQNNEEKEIVDVENTTNDNTNVEDKDNFNISDIKSIRINNSFVDASKDLKTKFSKKWKSLLDTLSINNDYNLLGFVENASIEVVSTSNVIFSLKSESEALIFNNNIELIEKSYNENNDSSYKFIGLSINEWNDEKKKFILDKSKKYEYIDEKNLNKDSEPVVQNLAEDLFGENLLEIR